MITPNNSVEMDNPKLRFGFTPPSGTSRDVYADRGYPSEQREAWLKENGFRNPIQRKGHRNKPLSEAIRGKNGTRRPVMAVMCRRY